MAKASWQRSLLLAFGLFVAVIAGVLAGIYFSLPVKRFNVHSELVMLGDFSGDRNWDSRDKKALDELLLNPYAYTPAYVNNADVNNNGSLDAEDIEILTVLFESSNPYLALGHATESGQPFPRPREFFRYISKYRYVQRPLYVLPHETMEISPFAFANELKTDLREDSYENQLIMEVYDEALRFSIAYEKRKNDLADIERKYVADKIRKCDELYSKGEFYELLLNLIALVEDAETLTVKGQHPFIGKLLFFRDHLRELLVSDVFERFKTGELSYSHVFMEMDAYLRSDMGIDVSMESLEPPRDLRQIRNYLDRAEWQYYKSSTSDEDFLKLLLYAQHDRRYLRSVSKTTPKHSDLKVENHNLPMILLFRESLRIKDNDKKAAVGMLDEAIRIPFGWVKSIPRQQLPESIALENFLLPGNKEDGYDKSRHWNVFGGVSLYRSPEESLVLALRREIMDAREEGYTAEAMVKFIRDMIANINGIYYVMSLNPDLLQSM